MSAASMAGDDVTDAVEGLGEAAPEETAGRPYDAEQCRSLSGDAAIQYCTKAIDSGELSAEDLANSHSKRGFEYNTKGDLDRALLDFSQALKLKPFLVEALGYRGGLYLLQGKMEQAYDDISQVIRLEPNNVEAFVARGLLFMKVGNSDLALADFNEAIRFGPDNTAALKFRSGLLMSRREFDLAINDINEVIRLTPDDVEAQMAKASMLNNKAWFLATTSNTNVRNGREAVRAALEAITLINIPGFRDTLAAAYAEVGQFDAAVTEMELVIEMLRAAGEQSEVAGAQSRLDLYRRGQPYRE